MKKVMLAQLVLSLGFIVLTASTAIACTLSTPFGCACAGVSCNYVEPGNIAWIKCETAQGKTISCHDINNPHHPEYGHCSCDSSDTVKRSKKDKELDVIDEILRDIE